MQDCEYSAKFHRYEFSISLSSLEVCKETTRRLSTQ